MNALTLTLIRVAFLAVLWLFVIAAIGVVRTDLFGTAAAKVRTGAEPGDRRGSRQRPPKPAETRSRHPALSRRHRRRPERHEHRPYRSANYDGPGE